MDSDYIEKHRAISWKKWGEHLWPLIFLCLVAGGCLSYVIIDRGVSGILRSSASGFFGLFALIVLTLRFAVGRPLSKTTQEYIDRNIRGTALTFNRESNGRIWVDTLSRRGAQRRGHDDDRLRLIIWLGGWFSGDNRLEVGRLYSNCATPYLTNQRLAHWRVQLLHVGPAQNSDELVKQSLVLLVDKNNQSMKMTVTELMEFFERHVIPGTFDTENSLAFILGTMHRGWEKLAVGYKDARERLDWANNAIMAAIREIIESRRFVNSNEAKVIRERLEAAARRTLSPDDERRKLVTETSGKKNGGGGGNEGGKKLLS